MMTRLEQRQSGPGRRMQLAIDKAVEANDASLATRNYKTNSIRLRALDLEHTVVLVEPFFAIVGSI